MIKMYYKEKEISINEANELYKMNKENENEFKEKGYLDTARIFRDEAEYIKQAIASEMNLYNLYKEGDVVDKLGRGKIKELNQALLKQNLKRCGHCKTILNITEFGINNSTEDNLQINCNKCRKKQIKENHIEKQIKKDPLSIFKSNTYVDDDLLNKAGYQTLKGLNRALSPRKKKVCHKCRLVKSIKDFNYMDSRKKIKDVICKECCKTGPNKMYSISKENIENNRPQFNKLEKQINKTESIETNINNQAKSIETNINNQTGSVKTNKNKQTELIYAKCNGCGRYILTSYISCPYCDPDNK